jgi:hypothetical protein
MPTLVVTLLYNAFVKRSAALAALDAKRELLALLDSSEDQAVAAWCVTATVTGASPHVCAVCRAAHSRRSRPRPGFDVLSARTRWRRGPGGGRPQLEVLL